MNETEKQLLRQVEGLHEQLSNWTAQLVRIPTVSPYSGDDSAGIETAGQDWIAEKFEQLGAKVTRVAVTADVYELGGVVGPKDRCWDGRENVVAEWTLGDGDGPCIILNDHMDTVGTKGMAFDPFDPVVRDGKMYGRGTSDTKGNMMMGLVAVEALLKQSDGLSGKILFESVVDEECNGGGAGTLACCLAGVTGDFAICLDGVKGALNNGCNGIATARVRVKGRSGHAAMGDSVNAIDKGIVAKEAIDAFARGHLATFPNCLVTVGVFKSGTHPAIVPNEAELQINLSYDASDAGKALEQDGRWGGGVFRARFEEAMKQLAEKDAWFAEEPAEVFWIKDIYPFFCDPSDPAIRLALGAVSEVEGVAAKAEPIKAWFDASHFARQLHIPVVGMGVATPGCAHSAEEYVILDDLVTGAKTVALTLSRFLSRDYRKRNES